MDTLAARLIPKAPRRDPAPPSYEVQLRSGERRAYGKGDPSFTIVVTDQTQLNWLLRADAYSAALAFIRGDIEVHGDLIAAVRFQTATAPRSLPARFFGALARFAPGRIESWYQPKSRAARNIRFHYDRPNDFYRQFLDSRLVYSSAYYRDPEWSLEQAQLAKMDHICRKLDLRAGERFLDVGCGWGALVIHAAERYDAAATGCTLSRNQHEFAARRIAELGLTQRAAVLDLDYRDLSGRFDKIASVGMFEHVGRRRLGEYFSKVRGLLEEDGLFVNHGIMRPQLVGDNHETLFLQKKVFPGGELAHLSDVIREAEKSGFEVLDIENLRPHYALTCRAWVERLRDRASQCMLYVDSETYRTWLLYLAASARNFEDGLTDVHQLLLAKWNSRARPLTRDYMYL
jgi:cyclopropane-fatty-acyl-phospholipid synthase